MVRLRAFGRFSMRVADPGIFLQQLVGTRGAFATDAVEDFLRDICVARLNDLLGETLKTVLDLPRYYDELAGALKGRVADDFGKYGVELVDFLIGAITPPEEVQKMIDERASMGAIGDMQRYMAFKTARAMEEAATNPGQTGGAAGLGLGAGIGMMIPQMMAGAVAAAKPSAPAAAAPVAGPAGGGRREIKPGMSPDEVRGIFGEPAGEVVFGNKTRWSFADVTVIFENDKVSEVKF
jgi:membrane protease subunit (stomatin/prohibitin family)